MLATAAVSQCHMLLSNIFQTPKAQVFSECKIPRAWTTNIHLQTTCVHVPQYSYTILQGIQEFLTKSREYLCTFQLFIDATRQQIFGHNNIRVMNTSVDSRLHIQIFWIMWSVCHTQSASHSNTNWLQKSVYTFKMPNGMIVWRNVG